MNCPSTHTTFCFIFKHFVMTRAIICPHILLWDQILPTEFASGKEAEKMVYTTIDRNSYWLCHKIYKFVNG